MKRKQLPTIRNTADRIDILRRQKILVEPINQKEKFEKLKKHYVFCCVCKNCVDRKTSEEAPKTIKDFLVEYFVMEYGKISQGYCSLCWEREKRIGGELIW